MTWYLIKHRDNILEDFAACIFFIIFPTNGNDTKKWMRSIYHMKVDIFYLKHF